MIKKLKLQIIRKKEIILATHRELFQLLHAKNEQPKLLEARIVRVNQLHVNCNLIILLANHNIVHIAMAYVVINKMHAKLFLPSIFNIC